MEEKILILVKGRDQTEEINYYESNGDKVLIIYRNNKRYTYSKFNVEIIGKTREYTVTKYRFYRREIELENIEKAVKYDEYIKFWFNGKKSSLYKINEIEIDENVIICKKPRNVLEYLKALAEIKSGEEESFLSKKYKEMREVRSSSILGLYLTKGKIKRIRRMNKKIFPFGLNLSQREAVINAFENKLSIIEGPPGTGKTQTILNIIANAILNDKSIAIVSNNNSATRNVLDKLKKYELDFLCAYLGRKDNRAIFFKNQNGVYPKLDKLENEEIVILEEKLLDLEEEIIKLLEYKNRLAKLKVEIAEFKLEYSYFMEYCNEGKIREIEYEFFYEIKSQDILRILLEYEDVVRKGKKPSGYKITIFTIKQWINNIRYRKNIFSYIKELGSLNRKNKEFFINIDKDILDYFKNQYYNVKLCEIEEEILRLEKELEENKFDEKLEEYTSISMKLFKHKLYFKYKGKSSRRIFKESILKNNVREFIVEYPIILSTTHSLRDSGGANYLFDYVIVDEASQVDIVSGGLALSCAKNGVIVGDLKQLSNIINEKGTVKRVFERFDVGAEYMYENSLLTSITEVFKEAPRTLLREHYRCHPKIIGYCNKKFYNNNLIVFTEDSEEKDVLKLYVTSKGNHKRGTENKREVEVILNEVIPNLKDKNDIGIISPYRKQVESIQIDNIKSDTVHKYQGREKDTVIITTVSNEINDFIDGDELINVTVSRAVKRLILVTSDKIREKESGNIGDLIKYIKYNNFDIVESKIYSTFDFLYKDYERELRKFNKENKKISEYDSENLINKLIDDILKQNEFNFLGKVIHKPLQMLIKDKKNLNEVEKEFVNNPLSHIDFLIYNKVDKTPVLVIEVDGYNFHNTKVQENRDKIKDKILEKYSIPILRLETDGSLEKEKIEEKLIDILYKH
ncbi:MAG: AAA domain-containing protein [Clostridium sp.]